MRATWDMEAPRPFDLARTVLSHGFYEVPPFRWDHSSGRLDVALRLPGGAAPVRVAIVQRKGLASRPVLEVTAVGAGRWTAGRLRAAVDPAIARCLDFGKDLGPFHAMCRSYPPLRWVPAASAGRMLRCPDVATDVIVSICGTNTAWKQAVRCVRRLCEIAPECPGGGPRSFPTPSEILASGARHLVDHARVGYRHRSILEFCSRVADGRLDPERAGDQGMSGPELRAFFRSMPGIGPVTARYLACLHGRADEISVDSFAIRFVGDKYHGGKRPTARDVERRYARFGDLMGLAYWFEVIGDVDPVTWRPAAGPARLSSR